TTSGSSCSAMAVNPARSANRMVTVRRSPSTVPPVLGSTSRAGGAADRPPVARSAGLASAPTPAGVGGGGLAPAWRASVTGGPASAAPHSPQNLALGRLLWAQTGQGRDNRAPHSLQNLAPAGLSAWHSEHCTTAAFSRVKARPCSRAGLP